MHRLPAIMNFPRHQGPPRSILHVPPSPYAAAGLENLRTTWHGLVARQTDRWAECDAEANHWKDAKEDGEYFSDGDARGDCRLFVQGK